MTAISRVDGTVAESEAFDALGKRRALATQGAPDAPYGTIDNKGFTEHEMLDRFDLVHMNGRVYDPIVGRFLSADVLVQDPFNGQSLNRFSYVLNNPINLVDPGGYADKPAEQNSHGAALQKEVITGSLMVQQTMLHPLVVKLP